MEHAVLFIWCVACLEFEQSIKTVIEDLVFFWICLLGREDQMLIVR